MLIPIAKGQITRDYVEAPTAPATGQELVKKIKDVYNIYACVYVRGLTCFLRVVYTNGRHELVCCSLITRAILGHQKAGLVLAAEKWSTDEQLVVFNADDDDGDQIKEIREVGVVQ